MAGDIVGTVAVQPAFTSVGVLAVIVIRTFLSLSLQLEIEGRLPWQARRPAPGRVAAPPAATE